MKNTIEEKLEAIKEDKFKRSLDRLYNQLEEITECELDLSLEKFMELYNYVIKGKL